MSDIEVNILNVEKYTIRKKNSLKSKECMDEECHENIDNENGGNRKDPHDHRAEGELVKRTENIQLDDFDSDEDTFADADSDCEPNQFFLDEMLEDFHPERLNLFDYQKVEQPKKPDSTSNFSSSDAQNDENDTVNSYEDMRKYEDSSISGHDENDEDGEGRHKAIRTSNPHVEGDSSTEKSEEDDDCGDSFGNLPTISSNGSNGRRSMGVGAGPGRPLLRQPSQKAVWGK